MSEPPRNYGPYRIVSALGQGGMGVIYRAEHNETGKLVALKTVLMTSETMVRGIRREIQALARIRHPGIVAILDEGTQNGVPWYAMELLEGTTLRSYCQETFGHPTRPPKGWMTQDSGSSMDNAHRSPWWTHTLRCRETVTGEPLNVSPKLPAAPRSDMDSRKGTSPSGRAAQIPLIDEDLPRASLSGEADGAPRRPASTGPLLKKIAPQSLRGILTMVRRLCAPLAFLHGEGLVHLDLKPDNVLIQEGGWPVLVDFGLLSQFAGRAGRDSLVWRRRSGGTVAYMAPEQIRGGAVDARADLYALGCVLYELLTGRPPFMEPSLKRVLDAHLRSAPLAPSAHVEGMDSALDVLVLRLLAKDPRHRLCYADDVAAALEALGAEPVPAAWGEAGTSGKPYLYRPPLVGRTRELARLERAVEKLCRSSGGIIFIGGESGVGKTRLVRELIDRLVDGDLFVSSGECRPSGASGEAVSVAPLAALRRPLQALADRCLERGRREAERLLGPHGIVLADYEPSLAAVGKRLELPRPPKLGARQERQRLLHCLKSAFFQLARHQRVLLIIDDLHWADELTLDFFRLLLESGELFRMSLLVVATYRTDAPVAALQCLLEHAHARRVVLPRLDEEAIGGLVKESLGLSEPPLLFASFLARRSGGNPFFVSEFLRVALDEGLLYRLHGTWQILDPASQTATEEHFESLPLPRSSEDLIRWRLDLLEPRIRRLLDLFSVVGQESSLSFLQQASGLPESVLQDALRDLVAREILAEPEPGLWHVANDAVARVTYQAMAPGLRRLLHQAAATHIESLPAAKRETRLAELPGHLEKSGEPRRARTAFVEAARQAIRRLAHDEAARLYREALRLFPAPSKERIDVRNELGSGALHVRGRMDEAREEHARALAEARQLRDERREAISLQNLGVVYLDTGRLEEALEVLEKALERWNRLGDAAQEAMIYGNLGVLRHDQGRLEEARPLYERAFEVAAAAGDKANQARQLGNLAALAHDQGDLPRARELYSRSLALARDLQNPSMEAVTLGNMAQLAQEEGEFQESLALYQNALDAHRSLGNRRVEGHTLSNLAHLERLEGRAEAARAHYLLALEILRDVDDRRFIAITLTSFAGFLRTQGSPQNEIHQMLDEAEALLVEVGDFLYLAICRCERAYLWHSQGRPINHLLERIEAAANKLGVHPASELGQALQALKEKLQEEKG